MFDNYHPGACNNIGSGGQFFTPVALAGTVAIWARGGKRYLDLCAGIGVLSYCQSEVSRADGVEIVSVEQNPEFVKVGRKLLPNVTWIQGDAYDQSVIESLGLFDVGISNPPYGHVKTVNGQASSWLHKNSAHLQAAEILARRCKRGAIMLIPGTDHDMQDLRGPRDNFGAGNAISESYKRFTENVPGWHITPESVDLSCYEWRGASPKVTMVNLSNEL